MSSPSSYLADLVAVQGLGVATVAGVGAALLFNADAQEAVSFGAVAALATSVGDAVLTAAGYYADIQAYLPNNSYLDPADFVAGAVTVGAFQYFLTGVTGPDLYKSAAVGAVAGGTGRKLAGYLHQMLLGAQGPSGPKTAYQNN